MFGAFELLAYLYCITNGLGNTKATVKISTSFFENLLQIVCMIFESFLSLSITNNNHNNMKTLDYNLVLEILKHNTIEGRIETGYRFWIAESGLTIRYSDYDRLRTTLDRMKELADQLPISASPMTETWEDMKQVQIKLAKEFVKASKSIV